MDSPYRAAKGITLIELLFVIAIIGVLIWMAMPAITCPPSPGRLISAISNAKQIHLATMCMATDGEADGNKNPELGWPGDLKEKGYIKNLPDFVNILVRNDYLKAGDLKVFSSAGIPAYKSNQQNSSESKMPLDPPFLEENCAFKIYLVKKEDSPDTIFMATRNFTYGKPLNPNVKPYGDKGCAIIFKNGEGCVLKPKQAQKLDVIGKLPGGGTVESAENCLNPGP